MKDFMMAQTEEQFARLIWQKEPLSSGDLVKLAQKELGWKKSTTYTVLRRLCDQSVFQNKEGTVSSLVSEAQYESNKSRTFVEKSFGGSLPMFLAAFAGKEKLTPAQVQQIEQMIENIQEE